MTGVQVGWLDVVCWEACLGSCLHFTVAPLSAVWDKTSLEFVMDHPVEQTPWAHLHHLRGGVCGVHGSVLLQ
jgi:hypothetical protein